MGLNFLKRLRIKPPNLRSRRGSAEWGSPGKGEVEWGGFGEDKIKNLKTLTDAGLAAKGLTQGEIDNFKELFYNKVLKSGNLSEREELYLKQLIEKIYGKNA